MLPTLLILAVQPSLIAQVTDSSGQDSTEGNPESPGQDTSTDSSADPIQEISCEATAQTLPLSVEQALQVLCPENCDLSLSVWGTRYYTDDSSICVAAIHAGLLGSEGGVVSVFQSEQVDAFVGSTNHQVASQNSGRWRASFQFEKAANASSPVPLSCSSSLKAQGSEKNSPGTVLTVLCPANCNNPNDRVWGTQIYTNDSSICSAAVHAGVLPLEGGEITVFAAPGQDAYQGSQQNDVSSIDWGRWGGSFLFADALTPSHAQTLSCQDSAQGFAVDLGVRLQVHCPPGCQQDSNERSREIWGTEIYSNDSSVCRAAIHAGALGPRGGVTTLEIQGPVETLRASEQHSISSRGWAGPWYRNFRFVRDGAL